MIEIILEPLDLLLEVSESPEYLLDLDGSSGSLELQGPIDFAQMPLDGQQHGYLDLDLIGFPYIISAYDIAVKHGFVGTEAEWLLSLVGADGELGQAGKDGVQAAIEAAQSASGSANAAAGFKQQAQAHSSAAGQYASTTQELLAEARVVRDQTGEYAEATAYIKQQTEAFSDHAQQSATASQQARVAAETARSNAEISETRTATSMSSAAGSAASASENAIIAVEARNLAGGYASAALLSQTSANSSSDSARSYADAARQSQLIATAARDETTLAAQAVIIDKDQVKAYRDDAEAFAEASRVSKVSAETAAGQALIYRNQSATSATNAAGSEVNARDYYNLTVTLRNQAGASATAAATSENNARIYADQSGNIYGALATRVDGVEVKANNAQGTANSSLTVALDAQGKINSSWTVNVNANGRVGGLKLQSNGSTSLFDVEADVFRVWNGGSSIPVFEVSGGNVYIGGQQVRTESIVPNAVSDNVADTGDYGGGYGHSGGGAQVCQLSITGTGRRVLITAMYRGRQTAGPGVINATAIMYRNGSPVKNSATFCQNGFYFSQTFMHSEIIPNGSTYTYTIFDSVGSGASIAFYDYGISAINLKA